MKKFIRYALIGILIGSLTYLVILLFFFGPSTEVTSKNILSVLLMSAGIGLVSAIFEIEWNMLAEIAIHFILTLGLVVLMCAYNNWLPSLNLHVILSFLFFVVIYGAIWLGLYFVRMTDMKRLNKQIQIRKNKKAR
ncbi:DUF3021 domain-containing protein [Companilactobacillus kimchiensis]|uniref:DUF3021 domain-containing protein n=1 Tax=Companilactobacillus kimchiensis TaxID=993692 RepID=A0A0R2LDE5_9LACO|nr:DUF3021 domain-containing protein [Companilactobacillus kimchiensis]KRN99912.1 hypothetical protein IV57_GL002244 [Companilactobacillus kimchiensis]